MSKVLLRIKYGILKAVCVMPIIGNHYKNSLMLCDIKLHNDGLYSVTARKLAKELYNVDVGDWCNAPNTFGFFNKYKGSKVTIGNWSTIAVDSAFYGINHPIDYACLSSFFVHKRLGGGRQVK